MRAVVPEDAETMAALHAAAFARPWSVAEMAEVLGGPGAFGLIAEGAGFILCRAVADEAEILTLAVAPDSRRQGVARALVEAAAALARTAGARTLFLEVAADNAPALGLYAGAGFERAGLRRGYYGGTVDAVVMRRTLNTGD